MHFGSIDDLYDKDSEEFENRYRQAANKSPYEPIDFWAEVAKLVENWMYGRLLQLLPVDMHSLTNGVRKIQHSYTVCSSCV